MKIFHRKTVIFLFLVIFLATLGYGLTRINTLLTEFKQFFEKRFSSQLDLDVRIGSITGGIVRGLVFKDLTINKGDKSGKTLFKARRVFLGYRIWDLNKIIKSWKSEEPRELKIYLSDGQIYFDGTFAFVSDLTGAVTFGADKIGTQNFRGKLLNLPFYFSGSIYELKEKPKISFQMFINDKKVKGSLSLTQEFYAPRVQGWLEIGNLAPIRFQGRAELAKQSLTINNFYVNNGASQDPAGYSDVEALEMPGRLVVAIDQSDENANALKVTADHIKIGSSDFLSTIDIKARLLKSQSKGDILSGEIATSGTLLNYRPFAESECSFKLTRTKLEILYYKFGFSTRAYGTIKFASPPVLELFLNIDGAELSDLLSFMDKEAQEAFAGTIKGQVSVDGAVGEAKTKGHFDLTPGRIGDLFFESANINFQGKGPYIKFADSRLIQENMTMVLDGELDLRKLGTAHPLEGIRIKTPQGMVLWEGWDPAKGYSNTGATFKQSNRLEFGTYVNESAADKDQAQKTGVELEYKVRTKERLKVRYEEGEQFMGLEHKVKF